jgi:hypothetical protein
MLYRKTIVKKPRKPRKCDVCFGVIDGPHVYEVWTWDGELHTARTHEKCFQVRVDNCQRCGDNGCDCDAAECVRDSVMEGLIDLKINYKKTLRRSK